MLKWYTLRSLMTIHWLFALLTSSYYFHFPCPLRIWVIMVLLNFLSPVAPSNILLFITDLSSLPQTLQLGYLYFPCLFCFNIASSLGRSSAMMYPRILNCLLIVWLTDISCLNTGYQLSNGELVHKLGEWPLGNNRC